MTSYTRLISELRIDGNAVTLELTADWLQGRSAYGGWQAALALQAMRAVLGEQPPLRSLQCNFIAPVPPGRITARAELLRRGKSVAQLEARIAVDGKVAFTALGIFGEQRPTSIMHLPTAPADARNPDTLPDLPQVEGFTPAFMRNFQSRWGAGHPPYSGVRPHVDAQIYLRYRDDAVSSEGHLLCIADAIPPSALSMLDAPAMLSSINWTLEVIELPRGSDAGDWLRFDSSLTAASHGYAWENAAIWSAGGRLLALSRQCVAVFA